MAITRTNKIIICDTEAERNLAWDEGQTIWCKDTQKFYIIEGGIYVLIAPQSLAGYQLLIAGAVNGDIVTTDASGQVQDSGKSFDTDGTLTANSDLKIATQKAVKTYVDAVAATIENIDFITFRTMYNY